MYYVAHWHSETKYTMMYLAKWKCAAMILLFVWGVIIYQVLSSFRSCGGNTVDTAAVKMQLEQITSQLKTLRQKHNNLISQIRRSTGVKDLKNKTYFIDSGPFEMYENLRRRIYSNTKELWYYVNHELTRVINGEHKPDKIQAVLNQVADRKRSLLSDQDKLVDMDGYQDWRKMEAANVSDLVQRRLHYLQNPPDCKEARKLVCNFQDCGFGCQLHHIVFCLIFAYATERTLVLDSNTWQYNSRGWEYVFRPISETCTTTYNETAMTWPVFFETKVIYLRDIQHNAFSSLKPKFLPLAVPKDLAQRVARFNGDPASWWIAQIIKYILKPQTRTKTAISRIIAKMDNEIPIVGMHVRRTDKVGTEAQLHHIKEYMIHVEDYFDKLELTKNIEDRTVFLATDDASVLDDARKSYPDYIFLNEPSIAKMAAPSQRRTLQSLTGLLVDLELLSRCDYLVCTMSSTVGRVAYELMQTNRVDASNSFFSLDDVYYYGGQNPHNRVAVMPNAGTNNDIAFEVDDLISIAGNHWNGYGLGTNKRTNISGLFPWYKTADHLMLYPFPEYKQVPLHSDTWFHSSEKIADTSIDKTQQDMTDTFNVR